MRTDVCVVGGGSGGIGAALAAARAGADVILVERMDRLGGTSTNAYVCNWEPGPGGILHEYSLVSGKYHYIKNHDGREEVYDLVNDPLEEHDLVQMEEGRLVLERFRGSLEASLTRS